MNRIASRACALALAATTVCQAGCSGDETGAVQVAIVSTDLSEHPDGTGAVGTITVELSLPEGEDERQIALDGITIRASGQPRVETEILGPDDVAIELPRTLAGGERITVDIAIDMARHLPVGATEEGRDRLRGAGHRGRDSGGRAASHLRTNVSCQNPTVGRGCPRRRGARARHRQAHC